MAKVMLRAFYDQTKEVTLGQVRPGHTVLVKSPQGAVLSYMIGKLGNSPITVTDEKKTVVLMNQLTGRLITKHPAQKCVVVSATTEVVPFNGKMTLDTEDAEHSDADE